MAYREPEEIVMAYKELSLRFTLGYFRQMLQDDLSPVRKMFNSLLAACTCAGHLEDAHTVFDEMIHLGTRSDIC
jgi:pentatricopeptide repeat protein